MRRSRVGLNASLSLTLGAFFLGCASPSAMAACHLNSPGGQVKRVVNIVFDNVHLRRDNPNVPSDLEHMPNLLNYHNPQLSNEEAWDVAAYVNSQQRPSKDLAKDWPNIKKKPFDHPFGPYSDGLSETHHKYGPWK